MNHAPEFAVAPLLPLLPNTNRRSWPGAFAWLSASLLPGEAQLGSRGCCNGPL